VVLYDNRPDSATYGLVNEIYRTELDRTVMVIPRNVFHAHENVGTTDALFVSMPTRAYQHDDPDVHRLPLDTDLIPYRFVERKGG
jgi:dTDP-4-dehydrorhamnose 3,5-epimerase